MERLSKALLENQNGRVGANNPGEIPERIIQFGEGNFLRGFIDWMVQQLNDKGLFNGRVVAIQPTPHGKVVPKLNAQDGLYTTVLRGISNGEVVDHSEIISSISRGINPYENWNEVLKVAENKDIQFVFSNTTEAGLTYMKETYESDQSPLSYPGKLTAFLYHRYQVMNGEPESGLTIIPCELVEDNGALLKALVRKIAKDWNLSEEFISWVNDENRFCNTLVDRIVTGYPKDNMEEFREKLGYEDVLLTVGEPYHLLAIDAGADLSEKLPFDKVGLNIHWGDVAPFRKLKVRILNGAHTMMFAVAYLSGCNTVKEAMANEDINSFLTNGIYDEILPIIDYDESEKRIFANSVIERFLNPYMNHQLLDISLNSVSKYKIRVLPTLLEYTDKNQGVPDMMSFSLAALISFYHVKRVENSRYFGIRGEKEYEIRDDQEVLQFFSEQWASYEKNLVSLEQMVETILGNQSLWDRDLTQIPLLQETTSQYLKSIEDAGMNSALSNVLSASKI